MFATVIRDHQKQNEYITDTFNTSENCLLHIEEYISIYIGEKYGSDYPLYYRDVPPTLSEMKYGIFVLKKGYHKYKICERVRSVGIIYNSHEDIKLFTISMAINLKKKRQFHIHQNNHFSYLDEFNECLGEIDTDLKSQTTHRPAKFTQHFSTKEKELIDQIVKNEEQPRQPVFL